MKIVSLIFSVIIAQSAGLLGSLATAKNVQGWYSTLNKPLWNPPNWLFGPVWIFLYALMGIAAWLIWEQKDKPGANFALIVYGMHLILNALWSIIFFGLKNPTFALFEIVVLLISILLTAVLFWKLNYWAGLLFLPYILWVSFAMILNYNIIKLN